MCAMNLFNSISIFLCEVLVGISVVTNMSTDEGSVHSAPPEEHQENHEHSVQFAEDVTFSDTNFPADGGLSATVPFDKFKVNIDTLMTFIFDPSLQWLLADSLHSHCMVR